MPTHTLIPALNVGVVGHRPNRLAAGRNAEIQRQIIEVLSLIAAGTRQAQQAAPQVFRQEPEPELAILSSLAEGADRMAADAGLQLGYRLHVPLPMPRADFEADFADQNSLGAFRDLIARAERVIELPATGRHRDRSYAAAARLLLDHCDILIAIWDGRPSAGRGGTATSIDDACRRGIPVVVIDAAATISPHVIWCGLDPAAVRSEDPDVLPRADAASMLKCVTAQVISPPEGIPGLELTRFMQAGGALPITGFDLATAFDHADRLASRNARKFRRAVVWNFAASFGAILLAAIGIGLVASLTGNAPFVLSPIEKKLLLAGEVLLLLSILAVTVTGWRKNWHSRWIEGRYIAEYLRASLVLRNLGTRAIDASGINTHWPDWYLRACLRAAGMPGVTFDESGLNAARQGLAALVAEQDQYHRRAAQRAHRREHVAEIVGLIAFAGAFGAVAWALLGGADAKATKLVLGITAIVLPALGASLLGIRMVLDYAGVAARSHAAARHCAAISGRLTRDPLDLRHIRARAAEFAGIALADVSTWRHSAESRKLDFPG